jgi:ribosomal protein L37AE/L43A
VSPHTEAQTDDGDADDTIDSDEHLVDACPECDGTGQVNERVTAPESERWKCYACDTAFAEPNRRPPKTTTDDADAETDTVPEANPTRPGWLADDPHEIVAAAPSNRSLTDVVEAVVQEENVLQVTRRLAFTQANQTRDVLQQLGLLGDDGQLLEGAELDDRLAALSRWIDDE